MLGSLTFFTGPMACGKTLELVRRMQLYAEQRVPTICIRPATDTRSDKVQSRSGLSFDGLTVPANDPEAVRRVIEQYEVIGVDEVQFFTPQIIPHLHKAMQYGKTVLVSGIDTDFRGEPFPISIALLALPETIVMRNRAVCSVCRQHTASRTQRLKNDEPVGRDEPTVVVEEAGGTITYEPRCILHHVVR